MPVGSGKSRTAYTIAKWAYKEKYITSNILAPTNILVEQYRIEFKGLHTLARKDNYVCFGKEDSRSYSSCEDHHSVLKYHCKGCLYITAVRKSHKMPYGIYNPYTYMAHRLYKPLLIVDEAHNLIKMITDLAAKRLWKKDYHFPNWVTNYRTLLRWVKEKLKEYPQDKKLNILLQDLESGNMRYIVERTIEPWRGRDEEVLKLLPIDISREKPVLWPSHTKRKVEKIILLSATLSRVDIQQLGLDKRRVIWIRTESPIPAERRPISYQGLEYYSATSEPTDKTWQWFVDKMREHPHTKGLIHMPYSYAARFRQIVPQELADRLVYHDNVNKADVYSEWRQSDPQQGKVLVASGMYEGIDLKGPDYSWQVILKVPYPSLGEPALKYLAEEHPERYAWMAIKDIIQASGRICRAEDDYGETYILDKNFRKLYTKYQDLFPIWFQGALYDDETV